MLIAEYRPGDEREICSGTPEVWIWRHRTMHQRAPCAFLARHGQALLGHVDAVPTSLIVGGRTVRAAQISFDRKSTGETFISLHLALLEQLREEKFEVVYAIAGEEEMPAYRTLELVPLFEVHARNLPLFGVARSLALEARRIRTKLIEVELDHLSLGQAVQLFEKNRASETPDLALEKSERWLEWRYILAPGSDVRMLTLRRRPGTGLDAFAIVRLFQDEGRTVIQLLDHATKKAGAGAAAWLFGELAMWGLAEGADVLQGWAASGSELDRALVSVGAFPKRRERVFMAKWIGRAPNPLIVPFPTRRVDLRAGDVEI